MTPDDIQRVIATLQYERDERRRPDERRRGQFFAGWLDATTRGKLYSSQTLKRLTWHNLGYRLGKRFGDQPSDRIGEAFEKAAALYKPPRIAEAVMLPEEVVATPAMIEGAVCRVSVNAYERSPEARQRCIEYYGTDCCICGFNFGAVYGDVAEGYIHVHHLRPLSEIRETYVVDPVEDLRPVCPNCHAVLHLRSPAYSIEEVRTFFRASH
jgi:hypothetical protein